MLSLVWSRRFSLNLTFRIKLSGVRSSTIRKEIKDILAYLRLIGNPDDEISFARIINVPKRGIGATSIDKIINYGVQNGISLTAVFDEIEHVGVSAKLQRQ